MRPRETPCFQDWEKPVVMLTAGPTALIRIIFTSFCCFKRRLSYKSLWAGTVRGVIVACGCTCDSFARRAGVRLPPSALIFYRSCRGCKTIKSLAACPAFNILEKRALPLVQRSFHLPNPMMKAGKILCRFSLGGDRSRRGCRGV